MSDSLKRAVIFGARHDGSAKVVLDIITLGGIYRVVSFLDDERALWGHSLGEDPGGGRRARRCRTCVSRALKALPSPLGDNRVRERVLDQARHAGLTPINAIHPRAVVAGGVQLGLGIWIAAGVVVNPGTIIGDGAVLNTGATVDHDCRIGAYANVSPGCHLSGRTVIGRYAFLGTGAITLPDVLIGEAATVGAGAVVLAAVAPGTTVVGVPARVVRQDGIVDHFHEEMLSMPGILGDSPALDTMMNIVRPVLPDLSEFEADFRAALRSGQVTNNSRFVVEFERQNPGVSGRRLRARILQRRDRADLHVEGGRTDRRHHRAVVHVQRHRSCGDLGESPAGIRRPRCGDVHHRSGFDREPHHPRDDRDPGGSRLRKSLRQ